MNFLHIAGHLGADAETRFTASGQKLTTFRVAVKIRRNKEDITIWYRVTLWDDRWERMVPYLKKGSAIMVAGELGKPEIYTDRNGQPQVSLEIWASHLSFSPFGRGNGQNQEGVAGQNPMATPAQPQNNMGMTAQAQGPFGETTPAMGAPSEMATAGQAATTGMGQPAQNAEDDLPF